MDKKEALKLLIQHSYMLSEEVKNQLYEKLPTLSDEQIDILGKFLANEKKLAIESANKMITSYDNLLKQLETLNK